MNELLWLFIEFVKTGLFAVGGGLATIPFLAKMSGAHPTWFSLEELANMIAISESTPGPLGVNMATYVGYHVAGMPGALLATFALALPAVVIASIVSGVLEHFRKNPLVEDAFAALRPAVAGLIAAAGFSMLRMALFRPMGTFTPYWPAMVVFAVVLALALLPKLAKLHPLCFIAAGAVAGVLIRL